MTDILLDKGDKQGKLRTEFVTGEGGGGLPYMAYTGTCCWKGHGFLPLCPE